MMDDDMKARFDETMSLLTVIVGSMATAAQVDAQFDALMKRMNDHFERLLPGGSSHDR